MSEDVKDIAQRLFNKLTREDKNAVSTVGIGKAATTGKPIFIAFCPKDSPVAVPETFEGYVVLKSHAPVREANMRA